jgi:hypothetical protein
MRDNEQPPLLFVLLVTKCAGVVLMLVNKGINAMMVVIVRGSGQAPIWGYRSSSYLFSRHLSDRHNIVFSVSACAKW